MENMEILYPNTQPRASMKYKCDICHIYTNNKKDIRNHLLTDKHQNRELETLQETLHPENSHISQINIKQVCKYCNKKYTSRSGLWKHQKKCKAKISKIEEPVGITTQMFYDLLKQNNEQTKQNQELTELMIEQNKEFKKQLIELSSKPTTTNNTNNTTNNTTNNFNLQFFLNETCKDALNISDFISQLQVGIKDLEETGRLGYAEGISKIFINGLKQLEINQRPVHCSDAKRETIYIKDKNLWEKDNEEKTKLTNAIRKVAHKNIEQISVWTEAHPEYMDYNSKYNEKYMKLIGEAMPGATYAESDKNYRKIARNITKETIIEK